MRQGIVESAAVVELWPENQTAFDVFSAMLTQWRVGMAGATGLDYAALPAVLSLLDLRPERELFDSIRIMESAALQVMSDGRQQHQDRSYRTR